MAIGGSLAAQTAPPVLPFDTDADVLKTPNDIYVGEVAGVGANSKGQIFVYTRTGHPYATVGDNRTFARGGSRLFQFDPSGKFVRELGQDVYGFNAAIGLRIDPQDNVWTIDAAANQVVKFDPDGRIALVLGRKPEAIGVRPAQPPGARGGAAGAPAAGAAQPPPHTASATGSGARRRVWNTGLELQSTGRRRLGSRRQHLCRRRHRQQQSGREVRQGRALHRALGLDRLRPRPVQRRQGPGDRRARQSLRRGPGQQAHPGLRSVRHVQIRVRRRRHAPHDVPDPRHDAVPLHLARRR